jgi:hypothetical protein
MVTYVVLFFPEDGGGLLMCFFSPAAMLEVLGIFTLPPKVTHSQAN